MQRIPQARSNVVKYEEHQFTFGGINHSAGARDGAIYDMENMALDNAPSLSVRKKRQKMPYDIEGKVYGIGSADKLFWCGETLGGEPKFYYDGEEKFSVSATEKTFAVINKYICIFPDKKYFSLWRDEAVNLKDYDLYSSLELLNEDKEKDENVKDGDVFAVGLTEPYSYFQFNSQGKWDNDATTENHAVQTRWIYLMDSWGSLEASRSIIADEYDSSSGSVTRTSYSSGKRIFEGVETPYIALYCKSSVEASEGNVLPWLRNGDVITIKKVKDTEDVETEYAKVIGKVFVKEFTNNNPYMLYYLDKEVSLSESSHSKVTIERAVPDLSFAFCHDNRLWGVEKDKIYTSKLGDPFNFNDYSTIADASWTVGIASSGPFTGGIAYNGYPTFFKEDSIIRVSGNYPSQYSTFETADVPGVAKGSGKSLAICNGYLYYLSPEGVCAYSGSYPTVIGENIGEVLSYGYGGAGSDKYFLEAEILHSVQNDNKGSQNDSFGDKAVYVYDTRVRAWTKEEELEAVGFTDIGRDLYALSEDGIYLLDSDKAEGDAEKDFDSFVEFAPIYDGHLTKKGLSKLHISLEASEGAKVSIFISYDNGEWMKVKEVSSTKRQNFNIPLTIRRCGTYRIRIEGKGNYIIYAIGKVRYFGSDM